MSVLVQLVETSSKRQDFILNYTGDLCGAIYLDRAFKAHITTTSRSHMSKLGADSEKRFMEKEWEYNLKRNFDGSEGPWIVELPQKLETSKKAALKAVFGSKKGSNILLLDGSVSSTCRLPPKRFLYLI